MTVLFQIRGKTYFTLLLRLEVSLSSYDCLPCSAEEFCRLEPLSISPVRAFQQFCALLISCDLNTSFVTCAYLFIDGFIYFSGLCRIEVQTLPVYILG